MDNSTRQCALLVDGDNLRGQPWATLLERARQFGRLNVARLYTDFQTLQDGGLSARAVGFELVHVLAKRSEKGTKSMVDTALATDAVAILYDNPGIDTLILGSGDADFMPIFRHWRRYGKRTVVMSLAGKISTELAQVADDIVTLGSAGGHAPLPTGRGRKTAPPPTAPTLSRNDLRAAILDLSSSTRLSDRETNLPLVRSEWLREALVEKFPEQAASLPELDALRAFVREEIPELEPVDSRSHSFLVGQYKPPQTEASHHDDAHVFEVFGDMCRECLPPGGIWMPIAGLLNEGKRLLEEGAGLSLPANRPTGWFRALLDRTPGIEVRQGANGHVEARRV